MNGETPDYTHLSTAEARAQKWLAGRKSYGGAVFHGDPLLELDAELLDAMNYVEECGRQGIMLGGFMGTLEALRRTLVAKARDRKLRLTSIPAMDWPGDDARDSGEPY